MCELKDFSHLDLDRGHRIMLRVELPMWHRSYIPKHSLVGKTVVDLGAGCGETAQLYLNHGASKVISVEGDPECYRLLCKNFENDKRVVPILGMVGMVKVDIEGGEEDMAVETHFPLSLVPTQSSRVMSADCITWNFRKNRVLEPGRLVYRRAHLLRTQVAHFIRQFILRPI